MNVFITSLRLFSDHIGFPFHLLMQSWENLNLLDVCSSLT